MYKKYHSPTEWAKFDPNRKFKFGVRLEVVVKFLRSGDISIYDSLTDAAKAVGCAVPTMSVWLNRLDGYPVLPGLIQVKYASDPCEFPPIDDPYIELMAYSKKRCVFRYRVDTRVLEIYETGAACAKSSGVSPTNLDYKLKSGGRKVFSCGHKYGYYPEDLGSVLPATVE